VPQRRHDPVPPAPEEIRRLLQDWVKTSDRFNLPARRPVVLSMTEEDLEKYFKRR